VVLTCGGDEGRRQAFKVDGPAVELGGGRTSPHMTKSSGDTADLDWHGHHLPCLWIEHMANCQLLKVRQKGSTPLAKEHN
jgi:hypothetical protein